MQLEGGSSVEASATLGAEERFFPSVDALVNLDVALIDEPLATVRTWIALLLYMSFHMFFQLFFLTELNAAATAEEKLR